MEVAELHVSKKKEIPLRVTGFDVKTRIQNIVAKSHFFEIMES